MTCLTWTSDGYALCVTYEKAWAIWSIGGRLNGWGMAETDDTNRSSEAFNHGVSACFWVPGNLELLVLAANNSASDRLCAIPFLKSATTSQHSPDNTRYAFLQMDDRVLAYRGADQPDQSVINPESDVWQHIKVGTELLKHKADGRYPRRISLQTGLFDTRRYRLMESS